MPTATPAQLDAQSAQTLLTLAQIPTSQLSALVLQQGPFLERFLSSTLRKLAHRVLECDWTTTEHQPFEAMLRLLENAARSPDPTLARRLLGAQAAQSIVDFAVSAANVSSALAQQVERVMLRLVDLDSVVKYVEAALIASQTALKENNTAMQRRTARVLSALLRVLPVASPASTRKVATHSPAIPAQELAIAIAASHRAIDVSWNGVQAAATKLALVDAAAALLGRLAVSGQKEALASAILRFENENSNSPPSSSTSRPRPLVDAPLLVDFCLAASPSLVIRIEDSLRAADSSPASTALQQSKDTAKSLTNSFRTDLASLSPTWSELIDKYKQARFRDSSKVAKGKARAAAQVEPSASLLSMVDAILPDLAGDQGRLRRILSRRKFQNKSDEETIQLLLDDQETDEEESDVEPVPLEDPIATSNIYRPTAPPAPTRANVFDSQPLDESRLRYGSKDVGDTKPDMPSSLKASILARVQAQDEEEHAASQEWNPFADEERVHSRDVGFEEELEDEDDRINRRYAISNLGGERGNAGEWRKRLEDYDESDEEQDDSDDKDQDEATSAVSAERNGERVLILAYSRHGQGLFSKDAATRKSAQRKALKAELESVTGKAYDDNLIESWGTMFERNPRKDTLLNSASSFELMSRGSNAAPQQTERKFGPDKGRGGRVLRGAGRGGGRGGSSGGADSGSARGGRGGADNTRGGHSGNNRGAKKKEQRGNSARTRGADRKARAMGGAGAGV